MLMCLHLSAASWPPCGKGQEGQGVPSPLKPGARPGEGPLQGSKSGKGQERSWGCVVGSSPPVGLRTTLPLHLKQRVLNFPGVRLGNWL